PTPQSFPVARHPLQLYLQPVMPAPTVVAQEHGRAVAGGDEEVGIAVVIEIAPGQAPPHPPRPQRGTGLLADLHELRTPGGFGAGAVVEGQPLREGDPLAQPIHVLVDVAVGSEDVWE